MLRQCILTLTIVGTGCSAEPPSVTIASALAPSCQSLDSLSTEHKAKVESAASASYQLVDAGARSDIGGASRVEIRFSEQARDSCSSVQRTAVCFVGLADTATERSAVQQVWAPIVAGLCASPSAVPSPDLVIPPSASSAVVPSDSRLPR